MTRVAVIGTVGIPARYGGFETLAQHLTAELGKDFELTVYCSAKAYVERPAQYNGARLVYLPLDANGVQSIAYDVLAILRSLRQFDVLLVLGVSGCLVLPLVRPFFRGKIIVNIDGLEWQRDKWRGFPGKFLRLSEAVAVRTADCVVADNKVIQDYIRTQYGKPSALIPYGADHVAPLALDDATLQRYPFLRERYAFTVCRIEPENNIHLILAAMAEATLPYVLVGNWEASDYGRALRERYRAIAHLHLLDPVYELDVLDRLRSNAFLYLHGHSAGGTNPSLVEAMYLGLAIIAFDVGYNRETTENRCLYFSDTASLQRAVQQCDDASRTRIGNDMREIAGRRYRWAIIAGQYAQLFGQGSQADVA